MTAAALEGQVALVTGGSSGIGLAIARRLAVAGAEVAVVASGNRAKAEAAAERIVRDGGKAVGFVADVSRPDQVSTLVSDVSARIGVPDILINSAGVWYASPLGSMDDRQIDEMIDVNLKGVIRMTAAVAPAMTARRSGRIVNIASVAGIVPSPGYSLYSTAKAAVIAFTKATALELAPFDIAVNAISPGNTATPINAEVRESPAFAARRDWIARITPSTRSFTPAEEIAEAALFLVDGRVRGMHGAVIAIDEGRSAGLTARLD